MCKQTCKSRHFPSCSCVWNKFIASHSSSSLFRESSATCRHAPVLQPIIRRHSAAGAAGGNEESWRNGCCAAVTDSLLEVLLWSPELLSVPPPQQGPLHWRLQKCLLAVRKGTATAALQPCDSKTLSRKASANGIQRGRMHHTPRRRRNHRWTAIYISAGVRKESRAAAREVASSQRLFCLKKAFCPEFDLSCTEGSF